MSDVAWEPVAKFRRTAWQLQARDFSEDGLGILPLGAVNAVVHLSPLGA